jgi:hypothetical protein
MAIRALLVPITYVTIIVMMVLMIPTNFVTIIVIIQANALVIAVLRLDCSDGTIIMVNMMLHNT